MDREAALREVSAGQQHRQQSFAHRACVPGERRLHCAPRMRVRATALQAICVGSTTQP
jgi:hypothetical protein